MRIKNGFSLIELIMVIAILGLIMLISFPKATNVLTKMQEDEKNNNEELIIKSLELYLNDNLELSTKITTGSCYLETTDIPSTYGISSSSLLYITYNQTNHDYLLTKDKPNQEKCI